VQYIEVEKKFALSDPEPLKWRTPRLRPVLFLLSLTPTTFGLNAGVDTLPSDGVQCYT
jgi:hypothetical protein